MAYSDKRDEARRLRQQGFSVRDITKLLGVSKGSVSLWVKDIELSEEQRRHLKSRQRQVGSNNQGSKTNEVTYRERRRQYQEVGRARAREGSKLHLIGCMLYWAEGAKKRNTLYFANSDANMLLIYLRFLKEELNVITEAIKIQIHCHATDEMEVKRIENYWLALLQLPPSALHKTQVKMGSVTHHNVLPNGVCGLRVNSTELTMHVFGAIQEYGGFENPA